MNAFSLTDIDMLNPATRAFVNKDPGLTELTGRNHAFFTPEAGISGKAEFSPLKREILRNELLSQYRKIAEICPVNSLVLENINALNHPDTYTVCTGQQLHLFGGPAFVLYKILALIDLAARYKKTYPGKNFIPVYWMASEDHDVDEIRDNRIFRNNYRWETTQTGACGRFTVQDTLELIESMRNDIQMNNDSAQLLDSISEIYKGAENLSQATAGMMNHLFGTYGLVCIDADRPAFKAEFREVMKSDILHNKNEPAFNAFSDKLEDAGFTRQLHGRSVNFFFLQNGMRSRIEKNGTIFHAAGTELNADDRAMETLIETEPEKFSPNAMLRPLYQETILPNVAYLGGNAEINYWLQTCEVFKFNNIAPPTIYLRPSLWIIPHKAHVWLEKYKISPLDLLITQSNEKLASLLSPEIADLKQEIIKFNSLRTEIQNAVYQHNTNFMKTLTEAGKQYEKILHQADKQIREIQLSRLGKDFEKLKEIQSNYLDINHIQERVTHLLEMLIKHDNVVFSIMNQHLTETGKGYFIPM